MKRLLQELHQGKNLDKNLKEYKELALETYEAYSVLELTFSACFAIPMRQKKYQKIKNWQKMPAKDSLRR